MRMISGLPGEPISLLMRDPPTRRAPVVVDQQDRCAGGIPLTTTIASRLDCWRARRQLRGPVALVGRRSRTSAKVIWRKSRRPRNCAAVEPSAVPFSPAGRPVPRSRLPMSWSTIPGEAVDVEPSSTSWAGARRECREMLITDRPGVRARRSPGGGEPPGGHRKVDVVGEVDEVQAFGWPILRRCGVGGRRSR